MGSEMCIRDRNKVVIITEKTLKKLVKEFLITIGLLSIATVIGMLLIYIGFTESNVIMVYLLCVLLISIFTNGYIWSVAGSLVSVVLMNFFLTEPRFTLHTYDTGYPLTCVIMLAASMLTGTLASKLKKHVRMSEQAAYREKTLQLRANLLRTISHDLRTPLTSISGNANNLMYNYDKLDNDTREQIFTDIYDDSEWLISLVENILFVTRFEDGTVTLNMSDQLIDEVIAEALKHINRKSCEHKIHVDCGKELLLVRMDVRLIIQVIINIVDNAIKYTQEGSDIYIKARKEGRYVIISVEDNGEGIPDDMKENVFDTFFTCNNEIADNRRSLGLGLSLCKTIINAHGSELELRDNTPHGCIFEFKLQLSEVHLNE
mgnify:FL=1